MNNSLKIGIVAGLIAGLITGIVAFIQALIEFNLGIPYWALPPPPETPIIKIATTEIAINLIWGIIFGIIYSKAYDVIPGKGIRKGLVIGLFYYLVHWIRVTIFNLPYLEFGYAILNVTMGFTPLVVYGLVLGFLYEFLHSRFHISKKSVKIKEYSITRGIYLGAIAGFLGGIVAYIFLVITRAMLDIPVLLDIGWILSQIGTHTLIHMFWGIVFGAIYAKVYDLVPGKGITKGFYYGLIYLLITGLIVSTYSLAYGHIAWFIGYAFIDTPALIAYGLILGALYKPTK